MFASRREKKMIKKIICIGCGALILCLLLVLVAAGFEIASFLIGDIAATAILLLGILGSAGGYLGYLFYENNYSKEEKKK